MNAFKRELAVAFSPRVQPVWFRVLKWVVLVAVTIALWKSPYFWFWGLGAPLLGIGVHLFYRWKTHAWTRAWGGWNDLSAVPRE